MIRKFLPYIALALAAFLYFKVKTNQVGRSERKAEQRIEVPAIDQPKNEPTTAVNSLNRNYSKLTLTQHAKCRMGCRNIDESEIKEIIANGKVNERKIERDNRGATFPIEGKTHDNQQVRIVVAPKDNGEMVVVTLIDLDTDWKCSCK